MNQEAKHDEGKLQISLTPQTIIEAITAVRQFGNAKYHDPDNWKTVELERYIDAAYRHWIAFVRNHDAMDEDSGLPAIFHCACNLAFIIEMMYGRLNIGTAVQDLMEEWKERYGDD